MIKLKRLEVEGGFLNGVDLQFSDGLNVLIGARGSGKTSIIELLRYCLNVPAVTERAQLEAEGQALWVLGDDACATLTIEIDGTERVLRKGLHQERDARVPLTGVLFVSQQEIEEIGRDSSSRRRILDDAAVDTDGSPETQELEHAVETAAQALYEQRAELDELVQRLANLSEVPEQLAAAEKEQTKNKVQSDELVKLQAEASNLSDALGEMGTLAEALATGSARAESWRADLGAARRNEPDFSTLPKEAAEAVGDGIKAARQHMDEALQELAKIEESLKGQHREASIRLNAKRRELADVSAKIDDLEEGAGKLSRRISALREQNKHRSHLLERRKALEKTIKASSEARSAALTDLSGMVDQRYETRRKTAEALNEQFGPEIRVDVIKAGEVSDYERALGEALQGSNLQWRALAKRISERMSPREIIGAVERLDAEAVENGAGISEDRARRVVSHLAGIDTTDIVLSQIDEEVEFNLLDGTEMKPTDRLSLGQRCTVVLPLLLARDPDLAVLDQPEDHLDNAFIVETVVDALRSRRAGAQRLIATHNANIPVLGEADRVFVMSSSGSEAFVPTSGELDEGDVREAITKLMEGGEEAFRRRAEFYGSK